MPALFVAGSKLNHTCTGATTFYDSGCSLRSAADQPGDAEAEFVATRDVAAGEELTLSYLLVGRLQSTAARRAALVETKGFLCACGRCAAEPDWFRGLPCPRCRGGVVIASPPPALPSHLLLPLPLGAKGGSAGDWVWKCEECGAALGTLDQAVAECRWSGRGDLTSAAAWEDAELAAAASAGRRSWSLGTLQQRYMTARCGLGPWHWLPNMALMEVATAYCEVLAAALIDPGLGSGQGGGGEAGTPRLRASLAHGQTQLADGGVCNDSDWAGSECPELLSAAADDVGGCASELAAAAGWLVRWVGHSPEEPYQVRRAGP